MNSVQLYYTVLKKGQYNSHVILLWTCLLFKSPCLSSSCQDVVMLVHSGQEVHTINIITITTINELLITVTELNDGLTTK